MTRHRRAACVRVSGPVELHIGAHVSVCDAYRARLKYSRQNAAVGSDWRNLADEGAVCGAIDVQFFDEEVAWLRTTVKEDRADVAKRRQDAVRNLLDVQ